MHFIIILLLTFSTATLGLRPGFYIPIGPQPTPAAAVGLTSPSPTAPSSPTTLAPLCVMNSKSCCTGGCNLSAAAAGTCGPSAGTCATGDWFTGPFLDTTIDALCTAVNCPRCIPLPANFKACP